MSEFLLLTTVRAQAAVTGLLHSLAERLADDERGQDTIEYIGVLAVVAVIIGVVLAVAKGLRQDISSGASKLVSEVFNQ